MIFLFRGPNLIIVSENPGALQIGNRDENTLSCNPRQFLQSFYGIFQMLQGFKADQVICRGALEWEALYIRTNRFSSPTLNLQDTWFRNVNADTPSCNELEKEPIRISHIKHPFTGTYSHPQPAPERLYAKCKLNPYMVSIDVIPMVSLIRIVRGQRSIIFNFCNNLLKLRIGCHTLLIAFDPHP